MDYDWRGKGARRIRALKLAAMTARGTSLAVFFLGRLDLARCLRVELIRERQVGNEKRSTNQPSTAFTSNASNPTAAMDEIHSIILTRSAGRIAILLLCTPGEETYPLLNCCRPASSRTWPKATVTV